MTQTAAEYFSVLVKRGRDAGDVPELDSDEWRALADTDHRKVAAVCFAALQWLDYWQPAAIKQRIEDELAVIAQLEAVEWDKATARIRRITSAPSWAARQQQWQGGGRAS